MFIDRYKTHQILDIHWSLRMQLYYFASVLFNMGLNYSFGNCFRRYFDISSGQEQRDSKLFLQAHDSG